MSIKALSHYTFYSRYARYNKQKKRRENWEEAVARVFAMHRQKYADAIAANPELDKMITFAQEMQTKKRVLAAQRSLQFAGDPILKHELKMFNCLTTHIDREKVFSEILFSLLCGCGVGFSVQEQHVEKLPPLVKIAPMFENEYFIQDSIEGWADALGVLIAGFLKTSDHYKAYSNTKVKFNYSSIRPEGSLIAGQFKAPGHKGLEAAIEKIRELITNRINSPSFKKGKFAGKLRPIDCYDIIMHASDAVLSGGVRRSATICMFSIDDNEMMTAKTGNWFTDNPQRARSNNSVALLKGSVSRERFAEIMESTKQFGEPGFIWVDDLDIVYNPCAEIAMIPRTIDGRSGFQGCNLTEINGKWCDSEERFLRACEASAIIGTLQAGYTNFKYLGTASKEIFDYEALLGCSITGMMDNPDILFDPEIQQKGATHILKINEKVAKMIDINIAARACAVKPAGSTSCVLGTASGVHPHHARRYIRRVQANNGEFCLQETKKRNPLAVEDSVWSANRTDSVISFLCEVPPGAVVKNQLKAVELLERVKITQTNWVEYGTRVERCTNAKMRHNVSNTITVKTDEWDEVEKFIFDNQKWFAGISLLSASGDLDYPQAPFATVLTPTELVREYGDASVFASGLVVDGLSSFDNNLWKACDTVLGYGEDISKILLSPEYPQKKTNKDLVQYFLAREEYDAWFNKTDWVRRVKQFAVRYFAGDVKRATYCLKHVSLWKTWCDLSREYVEIDWDTITEEIETHVSADTLGAQACSGGKCEIL